MVVALAVATMAGGVYAITRNTRDHQATLPSDTARSSTIGSANRTASAAETASPAPAKSAHRTSDVPALAAAADDATAPADHVTALRRGLASPDEAARIAAVEAAVSATAVETLDELEKFELARDPETAPTVIHAIALLGASAEGTKRDGAAGTLDRWLHDELRRDGPDVLGNVSNIVEALGDVGGRQAVDALSAALDRGEIQLHVQTLAVQKLGELGDARARGPVERFATRVAAMPAAEGIDEELRVEAIEAARTTLSRI